MRLTVLGCEGPFPGAGGATSGYLVEAGPDAVALDMGSGTLGALTARRNPETLSGILFSHWHHDHCSDALPLIYRLQARGAELDVWGPEDPGSPVFNALRQEACVRLHAVRPGDRFRAGGFDVEVFEARHPVPAVMFRLSAEGKILCYTGDTNTVPGLEDFARNADLLLADGLFPEALWAESKPHLSAALAARLAVDAGAKRLVVTHLNPGLDRTRLTEEARAILPAAEVAARGTVYDL